MMVSVTGEGEDISMLTDEKIMVARAASILALMLASMSRFMLSAMNLGRLTATLAAL